MRLAMSQLHVVSRWACLALCLAMCLPFGGCSTTRTAASGKDPFAVTSAAVMRAPTAPVPLEEYFKARRLRGLSFSFDEQTVVYSSDAGGRIDLWVRPTATMGAGGGQEKQLTHIQ